MSQTQKTVVIVGGGYAGVHSLLQLESKNIPNLRIILISKANYFYHNIASPRALIDEKIGDQIVMSFDNLMKGKNKEFIHATVSKIGLNEIKYIRNEQNTEESINFDYLILGLGSKYPSVFHGNKNTIKEQLNELKETHSKVKSATKILILGGGPVGIEAAGEIATDLANVKVTLITSSNRLVPYMSTDLAEKTLNVLKQKKVEVILNDSVDLNNVENFKNQKVVSKNGKEIEFDAYFVCYGSKPCTDVIKASFPNWLNEHGQIKVNKYLQVVDTNNIFAIGDCNDSKEKKLAFMAERQAGTASNNIALLIKNSKSLKEHSIMDKDIMIMSVGRDNGTYQMLCLTGTGFLAKNIKSKDLMIDRVRKTLKLQ